MKINLLKNIVFIFSLSFNILFVFLIVFSSSSNISRFLYMAPQDYITSSAIVSVPKTGNVVYNLIEVDLSPGDTFILQFSVAANKTQSNNLIMPLYDPDMVTITASGYGIEITAKKEGHTLIQTLTNEGIRDIALITVKNKI